MEKECVICYSQISLPLSCGHRICSACAKQIRKPKCPICRQTVAIHECVGPLTRLQRKKVLKDLMSEMKYLESKRKYRLNNIYWSNNIDSIRTIYNILSGRGFALLSLNPDFGKVAKNKLDDLIQECQDFNYPPSYIDELKNYKVLLRCS